MQNDFGAALFNIGRLGESEQHLRIAMRLKPVLAMPHTLLGDILQRRGDEKGAEAELRRAVELSPDRYKTHNGLGLFLSQENRLDEAEHEFQKALELEPRSPDIACNLGELYWKRGNFPIAEAELRKAFQLANGYYRPREVLAMFLFSKADLQDREGNFCDEEETYREVMKLTPDFAMVYNNLGNLLIADSNRWDEAEALIRKSLEYARDNEREYSFVSLGELLERRGEPMEAAAAYRDALPGFALIGDTDSVERVGYKLQDLESH